MSYSYFVADLQCPGCGSMIEASVITKVESEPGTVIRVGGQLDVTMTDMELSHYKVRDPAPGEPLRILEPSSCPNCGRRVWVEVLVAAGAVRSIEAAQFDVATLDRVHFVDSEVTDFYEEVTGEPLYIGNDIRPDWAERLRARLALSVTR
jgi:DNA-directed RNA polymerase subunit RPC12/RpoP